MASKKNYEMDMTRGPLWGRLITYALPLMLSSFLQLLYNAADNVVVGRFAQDGDAALAAVSSTGSLINLIVNLFIGLSVGTSIVVARYKGAQQHDDVRLTVHTSIAISLVFGLILVVIGVVFARPLLEMMNSPKEVIGLASVYVRIYFAGMPFNMAYNFGSAALRAVGDTKRPMYILIISGAVNVVLNLLFVCVFHMDVAGVALATIISQAVSAVMVIYCLIKSDGDIHLDIRQVRVDREKLGELFRCGMPAGLQGILFSFSNVLIQSSVNAYGTAVTAGNGAASNLEGFVYAIMNTMYQTSLTFCGQNYGAKKYKRIIPIMLICLLYVTIIGVVLGNIAYLFGEPLIAIYRPEKGKELMQAGITRLSIVSSLYFLCGWMEVMCGSLRGMGKTIMPMLVSLSGACGLRVVWILTVYSRYEPLKNTRSLRVLYWCYPISWLVTTLVHAVCFAAVYKKVIRSSETANEICES